jgi:hypothetical protein
LIIEPYRVEKLKGAVATQFNVKLPKQSAIVSTDEQKRWSNLLETMRSLFFFRFIGRGLSLKLLSERISFVQGLLILVVVTTHTTFDFLRLLLFLPLPGPSVHAALNIHVETCVLLKNDAHPFFFFFFLNELRPMVYTELD